MGKKKVFWAKTFSYKFDFLVAICDREILGKRLKIEEGFEIEVKKQFYGEKLINEREALQLLKKATIANLMGEKIVKFALVHGFITKENVIIVDGIPHAQFVKLI